MAIAGGAIGDHSLQLRADRIAFGWRFLRGAPAAIYR